MVDASCDIPEKADDFEKLFNDAKAGRIELLLSDVCVAELVRTLKSYFHVENREICEKLISIINTPGFCFADEAVLFDALVRFKEKNVDFIDAYTAALALRYGMKVSSYDRDCNKFDDVIAVEPSTF